jgi:hypothetical protein
MPRHGAKVRTQSTNGFSPKNKRLRLGTAISLLGLLCWTSCVLVALLWNRNRSAGEEDRHECIAVRHRAANLLPMGREIVIFLPFRRQQIALPTTGNARSP